MIACGGAIDASLLKERVNYEAMMKLNTDSVSLQLVYAPPECPFQAKLMTSQRQTPLDQKLGDGGINRLFDFIWPIPCIRP
jgi:hypothetical protein